MTHKTTLAALLAFVAFATTAQGYATLPVETIADMVSNEQQITPDSGICIMPLDRNLAAIAPTPSTPESATGEVQACLSS
ncbi:hypothetical protein ACJ5NV_05520 [Loktanella agnita]|uniref:hypothetical protein n=1 Tax=Loktanella agnita TaxID=287097 RepID=UPI0039878B18